MGKNNHKTINPMRNKRIIIPSFFLLILLSACEWIEWTQQDAINIQAEGYEGEVFFQARNIGYRDLNRVRWEVTVSEVNGEVIRRFRGDISYLEAGESFSQSLFYNYYCCGYGHRARIQVSWKNRRGRTCYEWHSIRY